MLAKHTQHRLSQPVVKMPQTHIEEDISRFLRQKQL